MKLLDILNSAEVLKQIAGQRISGKTAYAIGKNIKAIQVELDLFADLRDGLVKKYGDPDNNYQVKGEDIVLAQKDMDDLLNTEVSIDIRKLSVDDLAALSLSPSETILIDWMIN
jgi:hypothetical protein